MTYRNSRRYTKQWKQELRSCYASWSVLYMNRESPSISCGCVITLLAYFLARFGERKSRLIMLRNSWKLKGRACYSMRSTETSYLGFDLDLTPLLCFDRVLNGVTPLVCFTQCTYWSKCRVFFFVIFVVWGSISDGYFWLHKFLSSLALKCPSADAWISSSYNIILPKLYRWGRKKHWALNLLDSLHHRLIM